MVDPEYKGYILDGPERVGCMSQGKTLDQALENVKDAIRGWLHVEKKHNRLETIEMGDMFIGEVTL